jgi:hypothetical protein
MNAFREKRPVDFAAVRRRAVEANGSPETPWGAHVAACVACGATGLPSTFRHCGLCGAALPEDSVKEP